MIRNLTANGVDAHGENPPDELFWRDGDVSVELTRGHPTDPKEWNVTQWQNGDRELADAFDTYSDAAARFFQYAGRASGEWEEVKA